MPRAVSTPPVKVFFFGDESLPGTARGALLSQTQEAISLARARGFGEIEIEVREGVPHGPLAAEVLAWFTALAGG